MTFKAKLWKETNKGGFSFFSFFSYWDPSQITSKIWIFMQYQSPEPLHHTYFADQGVEITQVQKLRFMFQNGFERHLAVFCIDCLWQSFVFSHLNGDYWLSTPGIKPIVVIGYKDVDCFMFIFGVQTLTYLYDSLQYSGVFIILHGYI